MQHEHSAQGISFFFRWKKNYEKDIIDLNNHDSNSTDENHMYEGIIKVLLMKQKE